MKIPFFTDNAINIIKEKISATVPDTPTTAIIIDLETLDTKPTAVVFNIAALFFSLDPNNQEELQRLYPDNAIQFRFDPMEQVALGRTMDKSTIEYWQSPNHKTPLDEINQLPVSEFAPSMEAFYKWVTMFKESHGCRVYFRGQDFDGPILSSLYKSAGVNVVWSRGDAPRDIRTYIDAKLNGRTGFVPGILKTENSTKHTALGDCYNDARQMQIAYYLTNLAI